MFYDIMKSILCNELNWKFINFYVTTKFNFMSYINISCLFKTINLEEYKKLLKNKKKNV